MLVLSRKMDESLVIDGRIEIVVTGITGNKVSLGIIAPGEVSVYRKELCPGPGSEQVPKRQNRNQTKRPCWHSSVKVQSLKNAMR